MLLPKGIIPALVTPFKEDGSIDYESYYPYLDHLIESGVDGLLLCGSTGEYTLLSAEERREVVKNVLDFVNNRVPVMVGVNSHNPEEVVGWMNYAKSVGAAWGLVLTPHYLTTSNEGIIEYYEYLASSSDLPIVIYHYPAGTGVKLDTETIVALSKIKNVVGLKNTADLTSTSQAIEAAANEEFAVLTGWQHLLLPTLAIGGAGAICTIPGVVPKEIVAIYNAVNNNDLKTATELNKKLIGLYNYVDEAPFPGNVKAGIAAQGWITDKVRRPLVPASEEMKEKMEIKLRELGYELQKA